LAPAARQLVVWLPPFGSPLDDDRAGAIFANAFRQFEREHLGVDVDVHVKAERGPAALLTYLRSAQRVAPAILPDLVLINTQELWQAADLGLVPALRPDEIRNDGFYAFASASVRYRDQVFGVPYVVDIVLAARDPSRLAEAPRSWGDVLAGETWLLFPTGLENDAALVTLAQYVGAGGHLSEDGGLASPDALAAFFEFVVEAQAAGLIPPEVVDLATFEAVWRAYVTAHPQIVSLVITGYHQAEAAGGELVYAPVPTRNGDAATLATTWAFAVLAQEEDHRRLALSLVDALLAAEVQGEWSRQAQRLPSRPAALAAWPASAGVTADLERQLAVAVALPNGRAFADFVADIQTAQIELLRGQLSADEALQAIAARP
jgi:ABC-type glycerol-3-phosphate transport system substrate-binding protein